MKSNLKIAQYSWWIGGILGLFIGLAKADGRINGYGMMAFAGVTNGIVWGWLLGFIIDKIKVSTPVQTISQKIEEVKQEKEIFEQTKHSLTNITMQNIDFNIYLKKHLLKNSTRM